MTTISSTKNRSEKKQKTKKRGFHVGSITPIDSKNNSEMFCKSLEAMCELGFSVSVLAEGDNEGQKACFELLEKYPEQFEILESISGNHENLLHSVDAIIFPGNPAKKTLAEVISHNIVSVIPEGNGLHDFDLKKESGEAFTYKEGNIWSLVSAMVRANENFKFPYDWKTIKNNLSLIVF